jgi:predicted nucleic acid-binding protein
VSGAALHVAEPPAHYLARRPLVVDCSVVSGAIFAEHWQDAARQHLVGSDLHAPSLIQAELANVAVKKIRRGFVDSANEGLLLLRELTINLHRIDETSVVALAQQYSLSAYDASYLWLAAELKCPLATFDEKLGRAAQTHLSTL